MRQLNLIGIQKMKLLFPIIISCLRKPRSGEVNQTFQDLQVNIRKLREVPRIPS